MLVPRADSLQTAEIEESCAFGEPVLPAFPVICSLSSVCYNGVLTTINQLHHINNDLMSVNGCFSYLCNKVF